MTFHFRNFSNDPDTPAKARHLLRRVPYRRFDPRDYDRLLSLASGALQSTKDVARVNFLMAAHGIAGAQP